MNRKVIIVESTAHWEALKQERAQFSPFIDSFSSNSSTPSPPPRSAPKQDRHQASPPPLRASRRKRRFDNNCLKEHPQAVLLSQDLQFPGYAPAPRHWHTMVNLAPSSQDRPKQDIVSRAQSNATLTKALRHALKRNHIPTGCIDDLERQLIAYLASEPRDKWTMEINDSYQRWIFHALCQYYQVYSHSTTTPDGHRLTSVSLPADLHVEWPTSTFLEYIERR
ncbi:hypothetical protein BC940DRAFT_304438 [Gongronella butleri]|nr:hypothetical protein BC940DRAFT_304438 [Gongronella butleri]